MKRFLFLSLCPLFFPGMCLAGPIIVGHTGGGSVATLDFATGNESASFTTDGAAIDSRGRAVEVVGGTVYYAAISGDIHLAPYNNGLGGSDLGTIPNPRPGFGVQDLDFSNGILFALTGYSDGTPGTPVVYRLNPTTGAVIGSPVTINGPGGLADGFTVLPNGDFLINDNDAVATYRSYSPTTGNPTGLVITLPALAGTATGVDYNPGDNLLYYAGRFTGANPGLARTTLTGTFLGSVPISTDGIEDISVIVPEPGTLVLCICGLAGLMLMRWRTCTPEV